MRTILLHVTVAVMAQYAINGVQSNTNNRYDSRHYFSGMMKRQTTEGSSSKDQEKEINQGLQEIAAISRGYDPSLDKTASKSNFEEEIERISLRNDIISSGRKVEEDFEDFVNEARAKRQVLKDLNAMWKSGVFYTFNTSDHDVQKAFKMGAEVWSDSTCIDFVEDNNAQDKVVVIKDLGSWSDVGRIGGDQLLALDATSTEGSAVHEIGHVLGLYHTMQRNDRDDFIKVVMQNVLPDHVDEFDRVSSSLTDVYGLTYDYGSVMHYGELSFSANQQPTMIAKVPLYQKTMGSDLISFSDIFTINEHYGCNKKCNQSTSAKCLNEGFPHPRNCSICICPGGYGGALCDRRPPGCGEDLLATNVKQVHISRLGVGVGLRDQFDFCHYMIRAPQGKKVKVRVQSISAGYDIAGCPKGGIEIKAQKDLKLTGYRFCSESGSKVTIVSSSNRVPVIIFNKFSTMQAVFTYRYTD